MDNEHSELHRGTSPPEMAVRRMLRDAFKEAAALFGTELSPHSKLSDDEYEEWRQDLNFAVCQDLKRPLPILLDELILRSQGRLVDMMVYFLDPQPVADEVSSSDLDLWLGALKHDLDSATIAHIRDLLTRPLPTGADHAKDSRKESLSDTFACFTSEQAVAVLAWLELASSWPELEFIQDDIESALRFWKRMVILKSTGK